MKKIVFIIVIASLFSVACQKEKSIGQESSATVVQEKIVVTGNPESLTQEQIDEIVTLLDAYEDANGITEIKTLVTGADILNARFSYKTALMWACEHGYADVASALIKAGSDIHAINKDNQTAVSLAQKNGHTDIVTRLLELGAKE